MRPCLPLPSLLLLPTPPRLCLAPCMALRRYAFALDPGHGGEAAVRRSMIMSLTLKIRGGLRLVATPLG